MVRRLSDKLFKRYNWRSKNRSED